MSCDDAKTQYYSIRYLSLSSSKTQHEFLSFM